jgi:hypothetical protein
MGEVVSLNSFFVVATPRRPLRSTERALAAHEAIVALEPCLQVDGRPTSGLSLLANTALVRMAHIVGAEAAAQLAEQIAATLREARACGWCDQDPDPRPAA